MQETPFPLEKYQNSNGLFSASLSSKNPLMDKFWIRDNYYIYLAVNRTSKNKIKKAFGKIVDKHSYKIKLHGTKKPTEDWMYIHPLYTESFDEIKDPWGWIQNDSVGNLLEIILSSNDKKTKERADLIKNYLENIEYWSCPDFGFWEEPLKELRSSSIASCIRALKKYQEKFGTNSGVERMIDLGHSSLNSLLPNETPTREHDLALLSLIWPEKLVTEKMKKEIINRVKCLEGHWGIKRYFGDAWNGKDRCLGLGHEMQWNYLSWMYLCTKDPIYIQRAREIKTKFKKMYEGFINGKPNNTHLLWAESMYNLALKEFGKR